MSCALRTHAGHGNLEAVRQLVTVETVTSITNIENADFMAIAKVRGWDLVVKKDEVSVGDRVLNFEIDSASPLATRPRVSCTAPACSPRTL
jgi:hypothetical protein